MTSDTACDGGCTSFIPFCIRHWPTDLRLAHDSGIENRTLWQCLQWTLTAALKMQDRKMWAGCDHVISKRTAHGHCWHVTSTGSTASVVGRWKAVKAVKGRVDKSAKPDMSDWYFLISPVWTFEKMNYFCTKYDKTIGKNLHSVIHCIQCVFSITSPVGLLTFVCCTMKYIFFWRSMIRSLT